MDSSVRRILFFLFVLALVVTIVLLYKPPQKKRPVKVTNFEECAQAGYPVMESYPRQCRDSSGQLFFEVLSQ
jgi:hypothetical protein